MPQPDLSRPIGAMMRPTHHVHPEDSLAQAAARLRENGAPVVPVVVEGMLKGVVTEASLATALGNGADPYDPVTEALDPREWTIPPYATGAEALRTFTETGRSALLVVDDSARVIGLITPSDLYQTRTRLNRPPLIGGMATPFGVYLTTGSVRAGATGFALVATGMLLFAVLTAAGVATHHFGLWLQSVGLTGRSFDFVIGISQIAIFAVAFRVMPLSGIHAAEHKVVHAIERGEELTPEVVRRMPRVHPRCGTNIAVGASLFLGIGLTTWLNIPQELKLLLALVTTLLFWRRLGAVVQLLVTTRPPSEKHLQMGIRAGKELLERHHQSRRTVASIPARLWNSGMFHVMFGSVLFLGLILLVGWLFNLDLAALGIIV